MCASTGVGNRLRSESMIWKTGDRRDQPADGTRGRLIFRVLLTGCGGSRGGGWKVVRTNIAQGRSGLLILSNSGFQVLVRYIDLTFKSIELRILKDLPPVAAQLLEIALLI